MEKFIITAVRPRIIRTSVVPLEMDLNQLYIGKARSS